MTNSTTLKRCLPPIKMSKWQPPHELPDLRRVDNNIIALDTETLDCGLQRRSRPGLAVARRLRLRHQRRLARRRRAPCDLLPMRHPATANLDSTQVYHWLKDMIAAGVRFITMNGSYDWGWLRSEGGILMPASDCLEEIGAAATLINENHRHYSLDALCERAGLPGKDTALLEQGCAALGLLTPKGKKKLNARALISKLPASYVGPYAETDAIRTFELHELYAPLIEAEGAQSQYRLECDLMPMTLEMRRRGVRIDQDAAEQARDLLIGKRDAVLAEISAQLGTAVGMDELHGTQMEDRYFRATRHFDSEQDRERRAVVRQRWRSQKRVDGQTRSLAAAADDERQQVSQRRGQVPRRPHPQTHHRRADLRRDTSVQIRGRRRHIVAVFLFGSAVAADALARSRARAADQKSSFCPRKASSGPRSTPASRNSASSCTSASSAMCPAPRWRPMNTSTTPKPTFTAKSLR